MIEIDPRKHRPQPPAAYLTTVAILDEIGATKTAAMKAALASVRPLADRQAEIEADLAKLREPADAAALTAEYLDGRVPLEDVIAATIRSEMVRDSTSAVAKTVKRTLDEAIRRLAHQAHGAMRKPGDDWLRALQPEFDRRLQPALELAAQIPASVHDEISARAAGRAEHRTWLDLTDALAAVDELHDTADRWRNLGIVPIRGAVPNDDLRWKHLDRLEGSTRVRPWFFCHNVRRGAEPGLFTEAELGHARTRAAEHPGPAAA